MPKGYNDIDWFEVREALEVLCEETRRDSPDAKLTISAIEDTIDALPIQWGAGI